MDANKSYVKETSESEKSIAEMLKEITIIQEIND